MKTPIDVIDDSGEILAALAKGALLTTKAGERVDTMTIGWGHLGIIWGTPVFVAYIRRSRFTRNLLDENPEFTVNLSTDPDSRILKFCGERSGYRTDKIADAGLTLVESDKISVPGIHQFPITLECKVVYTQDQDLSEIPLRIKDRFYPRDAETGSADIHTAFYGEIVAAYRIE